MNMPLTYGEQLRAARKEYGLTQVQLAERLGVRPWRITAYENWGTLPGDGVGNNIADELGVEWPPQYMTYHQQREVLDYLLYTVMSADKPETHARWIASARKMLQREFGGK
jgi:transcriptional regulator with XRE-family HTH domain